MKSDENKIKALGPHLAMAYGGEPGDTNNFADFVERNLRLFHIRYVSLLVCLGLGGARTCGLVVHRPRNFG